MLDELLWVLRREGFAVSTAQAIDVARAVQAVGFHRPDHVREAVACLVCRRAAERPRFDAVFGRFFDPTSAPERATLRQRLATRGFSPEELDVLRGLLEGLVAGHPEGVASLRDWLDRGADLDRLLAASTILRNLDAESGPTLGYLTHRLTAEMGSGRARRTLAALRSALRDALGDRGAALADALAKELEATEDAVHAHAKRTLEARVAEQLRDRGRDRLATTPFTALRNDDVEDVRRAVRRLAERLRGAARVRARHARRGRIDPHRTLRRALRTAGVPFALVRTRRRRDRPKIFVLCDVSDSVRAAAGFFLEFTYAAQELFDRARTFVFVGDLGETTRLFENQPARRAIEQAWGGGVVPTGENSNYGRALRQFEARHSRDLDRRTLVVVLGDGRTNFHDASPEVLARIRARCQALIWLCPERKGLWSSGDSAMARYEPACSAVYEVTCARELEQAARRIVTRG
jgi:hypothetical protein